ncbi:HAD-IC family P-type ATPase [Actinokineospora auranticolor]|uniref:P-type E1-E2 ATPase n=1 Tax=Actinokineospora auranticolor TaxID=155976 RepID=A0A2S6GIQ0_9PSEU|nr:HAD-IC family P-type ATPase [Actinokineospora auranticolor]PPK65112.1 P-type E1-E2 ATPase [Actinokineospora auranticolor]
MTVAHARSVDDSRKATGADLDRGLSVQEARARLDHSGPNELPPPRRRGALVRVAGQVHHPLIYVLLGSALATGLLGGIVDASVILGVVVVNALIGFLQEGRAERALDALAAATRTKATAIRDGVATEVASTNLVIGDLVLLDEGDRVPADLRLVYTRELRIDESALTGESRPAAKDPLDLPAATEPADRTNMAHAGTLVTSGGGRGVVVATAADTEIGRVHHLVAVTGRWTRR